jgi:hypothetical protein
MDVASPNDRCGLTEGGVVMYEYKVLTERDKKFSGNFDVGDLEATLNAYAEEGWRLVEALVTTNVMKTAKAEFVMVLERERADVRGG